MLMRKHLYFYAIIKTLWQFYFNIINFLCNPIALSKNIILIVNPSAAWNTILNTPLQTLSVWLIHMYENISWLYFHCRTLLKFFISGYSENTV